MRAVEEDLLARHRIDRSHRLVGTADGDHTTVRRPAGPVQGVVGQWHRDRQFPPGHVPDLHFTHPSREAAGHGQLAAVG